MQKEQHINYEEIESLLCERIFELGNRNIDQRVNNLNNYNKDIEGKELSKEEKIDIQIRREVPKEDLNGVSLYINTTENIRYIIKDLKDGLKAYLYLVDAEGEELKYKIYTLNEFYEYKGEVIDFYEEDIIIDGYSNKELFDYITKDLDMKNENIKSFCEEWYLIANNFNNFDKCIDELINKYEFGQFEIKNIDIENIQSIEVY